MKKSIGIAVLLITFIASCSKNTDISDKSEQPFLIEQNNTENINIGLLHNQLLDEMRKGYDLKEINRLNFPSALSYCDSVLVEWGYDSSQVYIESRNLLNRVQLEFNDSDFVFTTINDKLEMNRLLSLDYSVKFNQHIIHIFDLIDDEYSGDSIDNYIQYVFELDAELSSNEIIARDNFIEVYTYSKDYWTNQSNVKEWGKTEWKYFNDALGAVLGAPFGGVGSALLSLGLSYATEKEYENGRT